jgi:hypothetical protein
MTWERIRLLVHAFIAGGATGTKNLACAPALHDLSSSFSIRPWLALVQNASHPGVISPGSPSSVVVVAVGSSWSIAIRPTTTIRPRTMAAAARLEMVGGGDVPFHVVSHVVCDLVRELGYVCSSYLVWLTTNI